jgi:hypothetical protein
MESVARLDACLTGTASGPRHYLAIVMTRSILREGGPPRWSDERPLGDFRLTVDPPSAASQSHDLPTPVGAMGCYDLPPGHVRSGVRGRETLAWVRGGRIGQGPSAR